MNLVQINERLKDLPMQVIQQYANGMNPEVPPYLALGELQRRETAQKQMATAQGGAQGPQPSIKEQVEQKAGLMAAQGLQQQQAMQQMAQQRAPGPVPAGMPQPEMQPEAAMASGGLTRAPVNFNFQHGGIVAFAGGGKADVDAILRKPPQERTAEENAILEQAGIKLQRRQIPQGSGIRAADEALRQIGPGIRGYFTEGASQLSDEELANQPAIGGAQNERILRALGMGASAPTPAPAAPAPAPISRPTSQVTPQQMEAQVKPAAPATDLKALAEQMRRQQAPRPMPGAAPAEPAPAEPAPESMDAMLRAQLKQPGTKESTLAEQLAEQKAAREGAGMGAPAGQDRMARIKAMQQQYESGKPDALDDLIRVFGQAGQYKGMTGTGPAYTANQDRKRAADLDMAAKINELMSGVESTQRGEQKEVASGALAGLGANRAARAGEAEKKLTALGTGRGQDIQAETQKRGQDLTYKAQMAQVAATKEAREQGADDKTIAAAEAAYARDPEAAIIKKRLESPIFANNPAKAAPDLARLRAIQASKYKQFGITLEGAPGAASPGGTTRMRFDAQGNPIK